MKSYMGITVHRYKILLAVFCIFTTASAHAQVPELAPLVLKTRYDVTLGGINVGRIRITVREDDFRYHMLIDTKSRGLVDMFSPLQSIATVEGHRTPEGEYQANLYKSKADKDGDENDRRVLIQYDADGTIVKRERVPGDDPAWRPVVPLDQASFADDPMTGFFVHRAALRNAMARNQREAVARTYDGARLADLTLKVVSRARIEIMGNFTDAINTVLTRQPINGYTPKELKKFGDGDPIVHIYFSADARMIPLMATVRVPYLGELKAVMVEYETLK